MLENHKFLSGLLALQLVIGLAIHNNKQGFAFEGDAEALIEGELSELTAFEIVGKKIGEEAPTPVRFEREGEGWRHAASGYPAHAKKIDELLTKLFEMKAREPIARSAANHVTLNVGARSFEKRLSLNFAEGKGDAALFFGNAKGKSAHVRFDGKDEVYLARGIAAWDLSTSVNTYVETDYVKFDKPDDILITNAHGSLHLKKGEGDAWTLLDVSPAKPLDDSKIKALVMGVKTVMLMSPVGKEIKPEHGFDKPLGEVRLTEGDKVLTYKIGAKKEATYYVKSNTSDFVVLSQKWAITKAIEGKLEDLYKEEKKPQAAGMPGGMPGGMMPGGMPGGMRGGMMPPGGMRRR